MRYGLLIFVGLSVSVMGAEPQAKVGERLDAARRRDRGLRTAFPYDDQGRACGPIPAVTTPIGSSAVLARGSRGEPGEGGGQEGVERLRAGLPAIWPADPGADAGADRAGPRRRLGPAVAPAGRRPVRHPLRRRGTSRRCFEVLQDQRGLSVQFMLDLDGTIYQTLDAKEAAWHATIANGRSIGIEVANIGAYPARRPQSAGRVVSAGYGRPRSSIVFPEAGQGGEPERSGVVLRPSRNEKIVGTIQGERLEQYDFTPQQYEGSPG